MDVPEALQEGMTVQLAHLADTPLQAEEGLAHGTRAGPQAVPVLAPGAAEQQAGAMQDCLHTYTQCGHGGRGQHEQEKGEGILVLLLTHYRQPE